MMDLKGLDYNTKRDKLILPEYGREIQKMVDHAISISDRAERQACAETIIATMTRLFPQNGKQADRMQKLWNHLALMSDFKLDIDYPVDISKAHSIHTKPQPLPYSNQHITIRHYGSMLSDIFEKLKTMEPGEERDKLVEFTANQMKYCLKEWSHGSSDNEKVADDLARFTDGKIQLDLNKFKFAKISANNNNQQEKKKKKR